MYDHDHWAEATLHAITLHQMPFLQGSQPSLVTSKQLSSVDHISLYFIWKFWRPLNDVAQATAWGLSLDSWCSSWWMFLKISRQEYIDVHQQRPLQTIHEAMGSLSDMQWIFLIFWFELRLHFRIFHFFQKCSNVGSTKLKYGPAGYSNAWNPWVGTLKLFIVRELLEVSSRAEKQQVIIQHGATSLWFTGRYTRRSNLKQIVVVTTDG